MAEEKPYFRYWGKADRNDPERFHLLPYHCLDVAAVASVWWDTSKVIRRSFLLHSGCDEKNTKAWVLFFVGLHDYGKFDVRFQRKADHVRQQLWIQSHENDLPAIHHSREYDHGAAGLYWFLRDHGERFEYHDEIASDSFDFFDETLVPNDDWIRWRPWIEMVCGHHGFIHRDESIKDWRLPTMSKGLALPEKETRKVWVECLESLFLSPCGLSSTDNPPSPSPLLSGFCSVADWLGSRTDELTFSFLNQSQPLDQYFNRKLDDARIVIDFSGITGESRPYHGISALLPERATPRGVQALLDDLPAESGLTIVEAPTGSGKTEMALAYAWRLLEKGIAESIIFALPTQATTNKMFDRLAPLAVKLFEDCPNVLLAHGNARFNEKFISIKNAAHVLQNEGEGWSQCCEWLSQSRKRVFLGQIGVCTVDQVLIAVLPVRHRFIRGLGAGRSVLIIDEVHAYDAYMYGLMQQVLTDQKAAGGSAILLSATLPAHQRQKLLHAWGAEMNPDAGWNGYPLITWASVNGKCCVYQTSLTNETIKKRTVRTEFRKLPEMRPDPLLMNEMVAAAQKGAHVALICNLVDDAQDVYSSITQLTDLPVLLFHSRYTLKDRMGIEEQVDNLFGKKSDRATGRILIGTQVLEQSLDYDVDWMITQLCPVDLFFQRIGRLHRHERQRPEGLENPVCTILLPVADGYGVHDCIYGNTLVMWRTARKLSESDALMIDFPEAYREWIEGIYDECLTGDEPQWVLDGFEKYEKERSNKEYLAKSMLKWSDGSWLSDTNQNIQAVTRDGEMSLQVTPFVQTPSGRKLIDGCMVETLRADKVLEAITVNSVNVPRRWEDQLKTVEKDDVTWLPMKEIKDEMFAEIIKGKLIYNKQLGMKKSGE